MNESEKGTTFEHWAIVELMGHRRFGGFVRETQIAGASFLRLDVPTEPPVTQYYAPASVYCITPTTEAIAREVAKLSQPAPVHRFELPQLPASTRSDEDDEDDEYYPTDEHDEAIATGERT